MYKQARKPRRCSTPSPTHFSLVVLVHGIGGDGDTLYLSFFVCHRIFRPENCTPKKCVNLQQKLPRNKTVQIDIGE